MSQPVNDYTPCTKSYISNFPYKIKIIAGYNYDLQFKEFYKWCEDTLGSKYSEWFLMRIDKVSYTLYLKDSKKAMFLSLKYSDIIESTTLYDTQS